MDYLSHKEIASVALFDLRLSEGELMLYESCIEYVLKNCQEDELYNLTGCESREELASYQEDLKILLRKFVIKEFLPEKYKK